MTPLLLFFLANYVLTGALPFDKPIPFDTLMLKSNAAKLHKIPNKTHLSQYISSHYKTEPHVSTEEHIYFLILWINRMLGGLSSRYVINVNPLPDRFPLLLHIMNFKPLLFKDIFADFYVGN